MSEYTKGEWRRTPINTIINAKTRKVIARLARSGRSQRELTANARLIAAAPDLLEACEKFMKAWLPPETRNIHQLDTDMNLAYQAAVVAIAKVQKEG